MTIGNRSLRQLLKALRGRQHYIALFNMIRVYPGFFDAFLRYFFGKGKYPHTIKIRTSSGMIAPTIYSYYDMLTVNEIFCRLDYRTESSAKVVVDFGSNIGISALYFLTLNDFSKCYLFEPVPENVKKLKNNLKAYTDRYILSESAVSHENGSREFGVEDYGRCGGLTRKTGNYIKVECRDINEVLKEILAEEKGIDVLKIDTEGTELDLIQAIDKNLLPKISTIFFEIDYTVNLGHKFSILPDFFDQFRYGNSIRLTLKTSNKIKQP